MSSLFNLMIDDIVISEADFSNDALSQCQMTDCPPEPISAVNHNKSLKLSLSTHHHSNEDYLFEKFLGSPLSCHQGKQINPNDKRFLNPKKCLGKVAWALFEEESPFEVFEENFVMKKKELDQERKNVETSEFLLDEENKQEDESSTKNRLEMSKPHFSADDKETFESIQINLDEYETPKKPPKTHLKHDWRSNNRLAKKTIKKSSHLHQLKTPKHSSALCMEFALTKNAKGIEYKQEEVTQDFIDQIL